jgi:hypothetical protein
VVRVPEARMGDEVYGPWPRLSQTPPTLRTPPKTIPRPTIWVLIVGALVAYLSQQGADNQGDGGVLGTFCMLIISELVSYLPI